MEKMQETVTEEEEEYKAAVHTQLYRARHWIAENPDAWAYMCSVARREAAHDRKFGMKWIVEETRKKAFVNRAGEPFKINNSHTAAFARIMVQQYPELRPFIEYRKSQFDGLVA